MVIDEDFEDKFINAPETYDRDFYIAAPWFTPEQFKRVEYIKRVLIEKSKTFYSPKDENLAYSMDSFERRKEVFEENLKAIYFSRCIISVTDDKDVGTIWETGYAYALNRPIIYFAETLGRNKFNLMLALSGYKVFTDRFDFEMWDFDIDKIQKDIFKGEIE
jgi:nucleoside 2-deoxyribosyltransferase